MPYETLVHISREDGAEDQVYLHAGKDIDSKIVDELAYQLHEDASKLWNITDYVAIHCVYDDRWYRIYKGVDRWTFWVEHARQ